MTLSALLLLLPSAIGQVTLCLPSPHDAHGWAVRVRGFGQAGPFFRCEFPTHPALEVILINKSTETRKYPFFEDALKTGELSVAVKQPDGKFLRRYFEPIPALPGRTLGQLRPGDSNSRFLTLREFGFKRFLESGEYIGQVEFRTAQGKVLSPPWKFSVVDIPPDAVLDSHPVSGYMANWHEAARGRVCIQQVRVGNKVFLVQRYFDSPKHGGALTSTQRITELPGKVEMTVAGEYGDKKPLVIRYRTSPSITTTLTVDSVNGTVWDRSDTPTLDGDLRGKPQIRRGKP